MAIYHFSGTIISRSQGRSAVAASAYRAGERLKDERQDRIHDYTRKADIAHTEILLPDGAPSALNDRETLWNTIEGCEKRKDAQLAREFTLALPRELALEDNITLTREFVQKEWVDKGMIADVCLHNDTGEQQPHAHVMLTLREVTPAGLGQKVRAWNTKEHLTHWREAWANTVNRHLSMQGQDIHIDHRSFKNQGIALEPQYKIGTAVAQEKMARWADHQRIARENGERIAADPNVALNALTRQQSTFTHHDLATFIHRHTNGAPQFQRVYDRVKASPDIVALGVDNQQRERFTTRALLAMEQRMIEQADTLQTQQAHGVSEVIQQQVINRYAALTDEQKVAFTHLTAPGDLKCVVGYAGTGKSYLLGAARDAWETEGYQVHGVTLSGIAAENLAASAGIDSRTLASREYYWDKGEQSLTPRDIVVVDEAGMLGSRAMARLISQAEGNGAKVILVGDPQQLQAIEAGAAFRAIIERSHYVELTTIRRQREVWQQEASKALALGQVENALTRYARHHRVHAFETKDEAREQLVQRWNAARRASPEKTQIMLTFTRNEVQALNAQARALRHENGELGHDYPFPTARGQRHFAVHDRIYFLQNNKELGVKNGTLGTIEKIDGPHVTVRLDNQAAARTLTVNLEHYQHVDLGYAATVHKSQGLTVDSSYLLASRHMDSHTTYVGATRHRESCDIFYSRDEFSHQRDLAQQLGRNGTKDTTLDYAPTFSEQRGFKPLKTPLKRDIDPAQRRSRLRHVLQAYKNAKNPLSREIPTPTDKTVEQRIDLAHFKHQFEAKHPEMAQSLQQAMPREPSVLDKRLIAAERQMKQLEHRLEKSGHAPAAKAQLEKFAASLAKDKTLMQHIKQQNPRLGKRLAQLQRNVERGIER